jgi:hypothetical protein
MVGVTSGLIDLDSATLSDFPAAQAAERVLESVADIRNRFRDEGTTQGEFIFKFPFDLLDAFRDRAVRIKDRETRVLVDQGIEVISMAKILTAFEKSRAKASSGQQLDERS